MSLVIVVNFVEEFDGKQRSKLFVIPRLAIGAGLLEPQVAVSAPFETRKDDVGVATQLANWHELVVCDGVVLGRHNENWCIDVRKKSVTRDMSE